MQTLVVVLSSQSEIVVEVGDRSTEKIETRQLSGTVHCVVSVRKHTVIYRGAHAVKMENMGTQCVPKSAATAYARGVAGCKEGDLMVPS